ncbi:MAG: nucleotidyl transferase AbiEii/AbiGii toxin family protein [Patescibacteria group bacterium]|nr:nucleotidyl transferase AbiEii/AbiGii toxin family protein [Patescibacteria group bacterium]
MLSADKLVQLAVKYQTTELNLRREYVQHVFLSHFYEQPEARDILFKGGTALRLLYNSPRFSQDLDFSTGATKTKEIENCAQNTLSEIEKEGIKTEIKEAKETTGGYLAIIEFKLDKNTVSVQLEISTRRKKLSGELTTVVGDFIPPYTIMRLSQEQLIKEKISALLFRQKPRDFYDLYFILRAKNLLPPAQKKVLGQVLKVLSASNISFAKELQQFLPRSHWPVIKDFKHSLKREIERYI